ncbi:hypothetical protein ACQR3P_29510 [Rhodococcus sp. IEGM1300]
MGTKIQDYDLEQGLRLLTADLKETRLHFNKSIKDVLSGLDTDSDLHTEAIEELVLVTGLTDDALDDLELKVASIEGGLKAGGVGEEDDEVFTYDPVTENILKHEVLNGGVQKYQIEYAYSDPANGTLSQSVKTYMDGTDTVTVTTTYTYNASGNISNISHSRVVTPKNQV